MLQPIRLGLLALVMTAASGWALAAPLDSGRIVSVADSRADDRERGYSDGLNGHDARERDKDYRAGYRAGRAKHEANEARRPDGRDYARGYRDGFNHYRERIAAPSGNRAYAAGYRAGQSDHTAMATTNDRPDRPSIGRPGSPLALVGRPAGSLDNDMRRLGYRILWIKKDKGEQIKLWRGATDSDCFRVVVARERVKDVEQMSDKSCAERAVYDR